MKAQKPAQGIMLERDFETAKVYKIACDCGSDDHAISAWIEIDADRELQDVQVGFYLNTWTPHWSPRFNRFKAIWKLLTTGVIKLEHHLILNKQTALNFSATIDQAIKDVEQTSK